MDGRTYPGKSSRIEPTAWALLALGATGGDEAFREKALTFLSGLRRQSGLLVDPGAPEANAAWNGLLLLMLQGLSVPVAADLVTEISRALASLRGAALRPDATVRQDNTLRAWPWIDGTFSWVEPTAYCTLALKKLSRERPDAVVADRLREADRLLIDRACEPAGWNYGNGAVLDQDLRPYVPTTALALLALQDRPAEPTVERGIDWLAEHGASERSSMALGLAAVCLAVFGRPSDKLLVDLAASDERTGSLGNVHLEAMALYGLTLEQHEAAAFRL